MKVWIYDECSYPSGFAGGFVHERNTDLGQKSLVCRVVDPLGEDPPGDVVATFWVYSGPGGEVTYRGAVAGERAPHDGAKLLQFYVFSHPGQGWLNGFPYVDLLHPEAAQTFLDVAYEPYRVRFEQEFGRLVPGCFTDEPHFHPIGPPGSLDLLPWTPDLPQTYQATYGEDLLTRLPELVLDTVHGFGVRFRYWRLISRLFVERWVRPIYEWCDRHGLAFTGHFWEHSFRPNHTGSIMLPLAWQHIPGLDLLGPNADHTRIKFGNHRSATAAPLDLGVPSQMGNIAMVKAVSSVAHQMGRRRVLSETYGAAGWEMSFEDQKVYAEWQAVLGVNLINPHLCHYSLRGERKHDHPPSFRAHQPWWPEYPIVHDYLSRLHYALAQGRYEADALVLHPMTSLWLGQRAKDPLFDRTGAPNDVPLALNSRLELAFHRLLKELSAAGWGYDLGDELILEDVGRVDGSALAVGDMKYRVLVLPACINLASDTLDLLTQWLDRGGRVAALAPAPHLLDGVTDSRLERFLARCILFPDAADLLSWLPTVAQRSARVDTREADANIYVHVRQIQGGVLVFAANMGPFAHTGAAVRISTDAASAEDLVVERWDLNNGETVSIPVRAMADEEMGHAVEVTVDFAPTESHLFVARRRGNATAEHEITTDLPGRPAAGHRPIVVSGTAKTGRHEPKQAIRRIALDKRWTFSRLDPNVLVLDTCDYRFDGDTEPTPERRGPISIAALRKLVRRRYGLPEVSFTDVQPWRKFAEALPEPAREELVLRFTVEIGFDPALAREIDLVVEEGDEWKVRINGRPIPPPNGWWIDPAFRRFPISDALREGENAIEIARPFREDMSIEPIFVIGDFAVATRDFRQFRLVPGGDSIRLGSWVHQGYPFYAGRAVYATQVDIPRTGGEAQHERVWLELSDLMASSCVHVAVNGIHAGAVAWQPYRVEITPLLKSGPNFVELEVANSLRNLLGPHHNSGRAAMVTPWNWRHDQNRTTDFILAPDGLAQNVSLVIGGNGENGG